MPESALRVVHVQTVPETGTRIVSTVTIPHTVRAMQELVGGLLDRVQIGANMDLWLNDEGVLDNLPIDATPFGFEVAGPYFIASFDPATGETLSLTEADCATVLSQFI